MTTEADSYDLLHTVLDHQKGVVTLVYSILEGDTSERVISETIMTLSARWRITQWVNGKPVQKHVYSTRFY